MFRESFFYTLKCQPDYIGNNALCNRSYLLRPTYFLILNTGVYSVISYYNRFNLKCLLSANSTGYAIVVGCYFQKAFVFSPIAPIETMSNWNEFCRHFG